MARVKANAERTEVKRPENLDLKKVDHLFERVLRRNIKWLKEMAKR